MRNKIYGRQLSRERGSRKALFRSLIRGLVLSEKIVRTKAKAKAVQPELDRIMNLVGKGDLASKRAIVARLGNDKEIAKILSDKYQRLAVSRKSGFSKITKLPTRRGDNAETVVLELVKIKDEKNNPTKK